ncbi:MAG: DEAD/DEAH box helicase, partial [Myxococcales bacterium]|nr:DEAD/DEAH box helicase [Myxococcales bacterium]
MPETDTEIQPTFDVLRLSNEVRKAVDELGYVNPTPVQRAIYEPAKKGRDLVVQARTGTGKTAAFGLPLVDGLVKPDIAAVQAMVLCPTRELALQVAREITSLGKYRELKVVSIYGGAPMQRQIDEISAGAQILVRTPGRVLDHLRRGTLDPARIRVLVLDESDEMLSMGFLPQINEVLEALPKTLHTLLFSATVPRDVVRMAEDRLRDPSFITLSGDEIGALSIQHFTYLAAGDKLGDFLQVVETENPESAIIFCNTREQTKRVAHQLKQAGYDADWLNADLSQSERERVMAAVRESRLRFLVATDVAARGIDISHLTHVINYDFPESTEVYVHRTGRTGRAGRTGTAISMITPQDIGGVYMLKLTYRITPVERSLPSATEKRTRAELDLVEGLVRLAETRRVTVRDRTLARRLLTHDQAEIAIAMLLQDHLGPRE